MFQLLDDGNTQRLLINGDIANENEWGKIQASINLEKPMEIIINSEGGDLPLALGMFAFLKDDFKGPLSIHVRGIAASAATLLLCIPGAQAFISEQSFIFLHFPSVQMFDPQNAEDLQKTLNQLEAYGAAIIDIYAHKTGLSEDYLKRILAEERLLSASEAINLGLCDKLEEEKAAVSACLPLNLKLHLSKCAKLLTRDELLKNNPTLYNDIYSAGRVCGQEEERKRLQELDDLAFDSEFSYNAKYQSCVNATQAALDYVKRLKVLNKEKRSQYINGVRADSAEIQVSLSPSSPELEQEREKIYKDSVFKGFKLF